MKTKRSYKRLFAASLVTAVILGTTTIYEHHQFNNLKIEYEQNVSASDEREDLVNDEIQKRDDEIARLQEANKLLREENDSRKVSRGSSGAEAINLSTSSNSKKKMNVEVTAYTLSESSCGKGKGHPAYGLTATGKNLSGHTLESARAIAVDPSVIPLGSAVRLIFSDDSMKKYNGVYYAVDIGGAIKGNRIDIFAGDGAEQLAMRIGRREAKLEIL